jgi:hypothetical protein
MKLLMKLFSKNSSTGEAELCQTSPYCLVHIISYVIVLFSPCDGASIMANAAHTALQHDKIRVRDADKYAFASCCKLEIHPMARHEMGILSSSAADAVD